MQSRDATFFAAGVAIGGTLYWLASRQKRRRASYDELADGIGFDAALEMSPLGGGACVAGPAPPAEGPRPAPNFETDEILAEHLTRNIQFFGVEGQRKIQDAFVVVVGLGVSAD